MTKAEAIATVRAQLGLDSKPVSEWTYEERTNYNHVLANFLLANPESFSPADVQTITGIANKVYDPLQDASFSLTDFGAEVANNVKNASFLGFATLRNLLYVAVVVAVVWYIWLKFGRKNTA